MLREEFSIADPEVQEYLNHRPDPNTSTWFDHCMRNGYTVEQMMSGYQRWKRRRNTIEHQPTNRSAALSL